MKVTFLTDKDKLILDGQISQLSENVEELKENAVTGKDGISVTHEWNGTVLKITSASGTSSVDLKGEKGETGADGTSVTVTNVSETTTDGGNNVVTFSDGKTLTVTSTVHNSGTDTMYFSFGAHPAFNINVGDSVVFAEKETFTTGLFNAEGLLDGEKTLAENTDRLIIDAHIFDNDAIFFENMKSGSAKIVSAEGDDILEKDAEEERALQVTRR